MAGTRHEATQSNVTGPESWGVCGGHSDSPETRTDSLRGVVHAFASDPEAESLARMIEAEIIPRLMLAHRGQGLSKNLPSSSGRSTPEDVAELARIVVEHDTKVACAYVDL